MNLTQRIIKNTASLLFSGILVQLIGFLVIIYLARILGPDAFGMVNFSTATVIFFTMITNMGLPLYGTREIARYPKKTDRFILNILAIRCGLFLLSLSFLYFCIRIFNLPTQINALILLYGFGILPTALLLDWVFQGLEKMEYVGLERILRNILYAGLIFSFVKSQDHLIRVPVIHFLGSIVSCVVLAGIYSYRYQWPKASIDFTLWKSMLRQAFPIGISILMVQVFYYIDSVMLGFFKGYAAVGLYNAANKIVFFVIMAGAAYFDAVYPLFSKYFKESLPLFSDLQNKTAKLVVTFALPIAIGGVMLAESLILITYGHAYRGSIIPFKILIFFACGNYINMIYSRGLWTCDRQDTYLMIVSTQAICNIVLNLFMIPAFGLAGAALTTVGVEFLGIGLSYFYFNRIAQVPLLVHLPKPALASMVMAFFLFWRLSAGAPQLFAVIPLGALVYFSVLFCIGGLEKKEIQQLMHAILE